MSRGRPLASVRSARQISSHLARRSPDAREVRDSKVVPKSAARACVMRDRPSRNEEIICLVPLNAVECN
jgi:hypothetical protein